MLDEPEAGALLELKENNNNLTSADANSTRGLLFPKVSLVAAESLAPLYASTAEPQKTRAIGMIVYNVNEDAQGIKTGLCVWNGEEWSSVEGGGSSSAAVFEFNCSNFLTVKGVLVKGQSLNPMQNTITLHLTVSKPGKYSLLASTDNGYYFTANGEFLQAGDFDVLLTGMGSPISASNSDNPDYLNFFVNGNPVDLSTICPTLDPPALTVNDMPPYFILNSVDVSNADLHLLREADGYLIVRVQANVEAAGALYHIQTNTVNGVKFEGTGQLIAGNQMVTLFASGTPEKMGSYIYNITSNSIDPNSRDLTVSIITTAREIVVRIFSNNNNDGWDLWGSSTVQTSGDYRGVRRLLDNTTLFGPTSDYCAVDGIVASRSFTSITDFSNVDIVLLSYNFTPSGGMVTALTNWVTNGGILIHCQDGGGVQNTIMTNLLGLTSANRSEIPGSAHSVRLTGVLGDSIVNNTGYLDLQGRNVGYDGGGNSYYTIPPALQSSIEVLATTSGGAPTILKSKAYGYILIGDGGPFCGGIASYSNLAAGYRPMTVSGTNLPTPRNTGGYNNVHNSHFFVNIMIWAIQRRLATNP
jgi:hypothetical protein